MLKNLLATIGVATLIVIASKTKIRIEKLTISVNSFEPIVKEIPHV